MRIAVIASLPASLLNLRGPLLRALVAAGHEVVALAPDGDLDTIRRLAAIGVGFRPIPLARRGRDPFADLRLVWRLQRVLRALAPDAVLAYTIKPVVYGGLAARLAGVPAFHAMITGLGHTFAGETAGQRALRVVSASLYRLGLARARSVFFQNPDDQALFTAWRLVPQGAHVARIAGSGVDLTHFTPAAPVVDGPVYLLLARLLEAKGIRDYVEAARLVRRSHPGAVFRLLGPFEDGPGGVPHAQIAAWQAEGIIEYLGEAADVRPAIAAASVVVLPSYYREGVPRSLLEGLAMGRPLVTTDATGCRETVVDGENGWLVPPRAPAALARAMARFAEEPALIAEMGARSLAFARRIFDVTQVNAAILSGIGVMACGGAEADVLVDPPLSGSSPGTSGSANPTPAVAPGPR